MNPITRMQISTFLVRHEDQKYYENEVVFADHGALGMFTFSLLKGDKTTALKEPNTVVVTEDMATKYFGSQDPIGKSLEVEKNLIGQQLESYILLPEGQSAVEVEKKVGEVFAKHKRVDDKRVLKLEQFKRMHLHSAIADTGDIRTIYIFLATGFLILLIACINFMNLSTARSASRAKEVGMRKVVGAVRRQEFFTRISDRSKECAGSRRGFSRRGSCNPQ